jgi:Protein of unknown function (DUF3419)
VASTTTWESGRLDQRSGPKMVLFGRMYEDVAIEREAFVPGSRVFSIASSGCTAMALAADHEVTAVDINPVQLDYAQRRAAGAAAQVGVAERVMGGLEKRHPWGGALDRGEAGGQPQQS